MKLRPWVIALTGIAVAALYMGASAQSGSVLSANLYGEDVVGGGAGEEAYGDFNAYAEPAAQSLCYYLEAKGVGEVTSAHVHSGKRGKNGRELVALQMSAMDETCTGVSGETIDAMIARPADYYVDVHTDAYPRGALRGQLSG
ncbi:CHRD domain-containing protein [Qipengyuania sp. 1XM1-15A]|uniref:CHRD domain-containing protein n=1 Tax=Qipengyuania xiamenensis TaxID=2867237 RepID=UPI001C86C874|nr:CHRD domain-containing protein [Qipengyuania xiamenensis]MBX7531813.1 CHRD domain-containing protein [Qipengyuania xiamenensis]